MTPKGAMSVDVTVIATFHAPIGNGCSANVHIPCGDEH